MDELDVAILRELSGDRVLWWGSLDPRLCAEDVARRLRVDPGTVRARLRRWEKEGFLLGHEVVPNPALFGAQVGGGTLTVTDARAKEKLFRDLALVDGALVLADNVGPYLALNLAAESEPALRRREAAVRAMPGVAELEDCVMHGTPAPTATPSALDWRILQALRRSPRESLREAATRVGVSVKTFARRYAALIDARAVWSVPLLDFSRYTGAVAARLIVAVDAGARPAAIAERLQKEWASEVILTSTPSEAGVGIRHRIVDAMLHVASPGLAEERAKEALGVPGVVDVELVYPRRYHVFGHWFDERIAEELARAATSRRA